MSSHSSVTCSILVACLAVAAPLLPTASVSACAAIEGAAVVVTASFRPAGLRLQSGSGCDVRVVDGRGAQ